MAANRRLVVSGGIIGWDRQGHLPAGFVAQIRQALSNVGAILAEGDARPEHLVRLTWYIVDTEEYLPEDTWAGLSRDLRRALSRHGPWCRADLCRKTGSQPFLRLVSQPLLHSKSQIVANPSYVAYTWSKSRPCANACLELERFS
jgi:endoribonuclease L-PSP